jgi:peptidoglycan DL-endopeptidase CwlO
METGNRPPRRAVQAGNRVTGAKENQALRLAHTRISSTTLTRLVSALLAGLLGATMLVGAASPAAAAPSIQEVQNRLNDLQGQAEAATEDYNDAEHKLQGIEEDLSALRVKIKREKRALGSIVGAVNQLARSAYTTGGIDTSLQLLMADDPTQFLNQASALQQVSASQAVALRQTRTVRLRLAQAEAALAQREADARKTRDAMKAAKKRVDDKYKEVAALLNGLQAKQRARLAALAREKAAQSVREAKQVARKLPTTTAAGSSRAMRAVRYALAQVGDRYVWSAMGPTAFDCSGLTLRAWEQGGVSLPHYSRAQFAGTRRIPLSQARPGDLVFYFGNGARHVGLYIGNGKMVHAANPRTGVVVSGVLSSWYSSRFSGIGRVLG